VGWSRKRRWTDAQLREAVAAATSYRDAAARLGAIETRKRVRRRSRELGLDTTHFLGPRDSSRRWTDEDLRAAVAGSTSVSGVIRRLGLVPAGGNFEHIQRRINVLGLDTSHMRGKGWNVGMKFQPKPRRPLSELLVAERWTSTYSLKQRLFRAGIKTPCCELCGWAQVATDGRIPVELDHINGDRTDNRIENLRIVCPNCHALQPTHRGLNKKSSRR
jgi:hypothetical protein